MKQILNDFQKLVKHELKIMNKVFRWYLIILILSMLLQCVLSFYQYYCNVYCHFINVIAICNVILSMLLQYVML